VSADLVVDATGRGSRTPVFLEGLGYGRPAEDEVVVHLVYVTQWLRIPPGMLTPNLIIVSATQDRPTGMALFRHENDTWSCTMYGMLGVEPPRDREGTLEFAAEFAPGYVMNALRAGELLGELSHYRVPSNRWRRYDKMTRIPQGLLVFGDAICSFNPVYGQGMSVAAMEAIALRDCLREGEHDLPRRFSRAAAKVVAVAWQMSAGSDLAMPSVPGRRSLGMRLINRYTDHVLLAAESDLVVAERFVRVAQFIDPPAALMAPSILLRVATANRRREPGALEPSVPAPA
jgi:2-polyprenyl-6-methoxyphenol hydroxylase-like FAD-dependent oxidoreductase